MRAFSLCCCLCNDQGMSLESMTLEEFVRRIRDDAQCFMIDIMRSRKKHPGLFDDKTSYPEWMKHFLVYLKQETKPRRRSSSAVTIARKVR